MFLQRISKPLAWTQLIVSVGVIATVIYGQINFYDTWEANGPFIESTRSSLRNAKQSLEQANQSITFIHDELPSYRTALQGANATLLRTATVIENISAAMRFSAPTSIEMQGIKPIVVMSRPLEPSANELKAQATEIRQVANGLQSAEKSIQTMPTLLTDIGKTMASSQAAITQLEPMIGQIEVLMNWGSLIALLIAIWCFLNSLSTLAMVHNKPTATNLNGVI